MSNKKTVELILKGKDMLSGVLNKGKAGVGGFVSWSTGKLTSLKNSVFSITNMMMAAFTGMAAKVFFAPAIKMETFNTQWAVLLGSVDAAKARMSELTDFAASTPFELAGVAQASRVLEVLTKGALSTGDSLRMVGDVAAGTQQPVEELAIWFGRLYDGIQSGRPVGEAMARLQELGVISGDVRGEIEDMQKAGADSADTWKVLTDSVDKFDGMMDKMSQTTAGKLSTLKDNFSLALGDVSSEMLPAVNRAIDDLLTDIEELSASGDLQRWGREAGEVLEKLIENLKTMCAWIKDNADTIKTVGFSVAGIAVIAKTVSIINTARIGLIALQAANSSNAAGAALAGIASAATALGPAAVRVALLTGQIGACTATAIAGYQAGKDLWYVFSEDGQKTMEWEAKLKKLNKEMGILDVQMSKIARHRAPAFFARAGTDRSKMDKGDQHYYDQLEKTLGIDALGLLAKKAEAKIIKIEQDLTKARIAAGKKGQAELDANEKIWQDKYDKTHLTAKELKPSMTKVLSKKNEAELRRKVELEIVPILKKVQQSGTGSLDDRQSAILSLFQQFKKKDQDAAKKEEEKQTKQDEASGTARKSLADYNRDLKMQLKVDNLDSLVTALNKNVTATNTLEQELAADRKKTEGLANDADKSNAQLKREARKEKKEKRKEERTYKDRKALAKRGRDAVKSGGKMSLNQIAANKWEKNEQENNAKERKIVNNKKLEKQQQADVEKAQNNVNKAQKTQTRKGVADKKAELTKAVRGTATKQVKEKRALVGKAANRALNKEKRDAASRKRKGLAAIDKNAVVDIEGLADGATMMDVVNAIQDLNIFEAVKGK